MLGNSLSGIRSTGRRVSEMRAQQNHHEADHEHRHGTMNGKTRNTHSGTPELKVDQFKLQFKVDVQDLTERRLTVRDWSLLRR